MIRYAFAALTAASTLVVSGFFPAAHAADAVAPPVQFTPLPERAPVLPTMDCGQLVQEDFLTAVEGAPARISSAELEVKEGDIEFCHVKGMIAPQIQFEFHLPTKTYTGRYLQGGCGGACGVIYDSISPRCDNRLAFGGAFAVSFNNSGHVGPEPMDTLWAAHAPQLREDFAYRAAHVMAEVGKEILTRFYGSRPEYSYFVGCSNGGREAMMEAQRFPDDFDGIIAGAPALWISAGVVRIIHESKTALDENGEPILTPSSTTLLHKAVMAACDGLDGLEDGQIDNPRRCQFDPGELVCEPGQDDGCITQRQAETMRAIYRGAVDANGDQLFFGGEPYGSELLWTGEGSFLTSGYALAANQIKFMIYNGETNQDFDWQSWEPGRDELVDLMQHGGYYNANNPDLSGFRNAGGKLIMWQGEADNAGGSYIMPDYYQRVRDSMGGFAGTDPFMRVYMLPGVYHCSGGYIAYEHDMLGPMVNWVERDHAPDAIVGAAILEDGAVRQRPVWPYPTQARYRGTGDINAADSFVPVRPAEAPNDRFRWLGEDLAETGASPAR